MACEVSVILPLYNVAPYIGRCIESLESQTFGDCEFVFVDDCSTDGSLDMVGEFAARDGRVRIVCQEENRGPGVARNVGIEHAQGKWLCFLDPDDWYEPEFLGLLHARAVETGADVVKGTTVGFDAATGEVIAWWSRLNPFIRRELERGVPLYVTRFVDHSSALYAARLLADGNVRYGDTRNGEDTTFLLRVCMSCRSIAFEDRARMRYRVNRSNSATEGFSQARLESELAALRDKVACVAAHEVDRHALRYIAHRLHTCVRTYCSQGETTGAADAAFAEALREVVCDLPGYERMKRSSGELRALLDHSWPITIWVGKPDGFNYDRVRRWTDLMKENPAARTSLTPAYVRAMLSAMWSYRASPHRDRGDDDWLAYVVAQIGRLELAYRACVVALMPPEFVYMGCLETWGAVKSKVRGLVRRAPEDGVYRLDPPASRDDATGRGDGS